MNDLEHLQRRARKSMLEATSPLDITIRECRHSIDDEERFHVEINGHYIEGHWKHDAAWHLAVGAGYGAKKK